MKTRLTEEEVQQLLEPGPPGFLPLVALEALRDWLDQHARIAELEGQEDAVPAPPPLANCNLCGHQDDESAFAFVEAEDAFKCPACGNLIS